MRKIGSTKTFKEKYGKTPNEFKVLARKLPAHCFKEAIENSFFLATKPNFDPLEMERYKLLEEVMFDRKDLD